MNVRLSRHHQSVVVAGVAYNCASRRILWLTKSRFVPMGRWKFVASPYSGRNLHESDVDVLERIDMTTLKNYAI